MKRKKYFLRMLALLALMLPWALQAQNAKVSEYDYSVSTAAYSSIAGTSGATAWTQGNYVDVSMPFAMNFGENQIASGSTLRVYPDGSASFTSLDGSRLAPLYYSSGYTTTATSIYTKSSTQQLVVEWRKVVIGSNSYSFQLKLNPNGNIEFCYGPMTISSSISVLVGLMSSSTDIYRVGGANGTSSWDDITRYTTGTTTRTLSATYKPAYDAVAGTGLVYTFTQPACVKPNTFTATATSSSAISLAWTVNEAGVKYEIKYSTNADFDPATEGNTQMINDGAALSYSVTGLSANTTYYFALRKYCDANTPSGWIMAEATTDCGPYTAADLPIFENFDSYGTGSTATIHRCWTKTYGYNGSHTSYPYPYSTYNHTADGSRALYFYSSSTASYRSWVAIPYSGPMNNICVNFWIYKTSAAYGNIQVGVMSDPDDFSTFELIENAGINTTEYSTSTWYNQEVYFDNYTGNGTYIVLLAPSGASNYAYVDDITISTLPSCRRISGLQVTPGGLVTWNAISGATFELKYATADFDPTIEGTANTVSTNSFQIPNPAGSTTYYVYVRNNCNDYWKKATFTTPLTMPFYEDFTSTTFPPSGWQKLIGLLSDAYNGTNPTTSSSGWTRFTSSYGLDAPHTKLNIYGTTYKYWLVTPNIYINGNADLSFDLALTKYNNSNAVTPGSQADDKFAVLVSTDGGNSWTTSNTLALWDNAGSSYVYDNIPSTGTTVVLPLTAYTGQSIMIAFYGESTVSGGDNDLHIDNISVDIHRSCAKPSDLAATNITGSSATVTWTENSETSATQWKVKWANHTFTGDDTDVDSAIVNGTAQKILTGLTPGTTYYFMVQSLCDVASGDISAWSNSGNFTTSFGVPFNEDFTSTTFPPTGWSRLNGLLSNAFNGTNPTNATGYWNRNTSSYGLGSTQPNARANIYGTSFKYWLVTPNISIDVNAALEFDIALTGYSSSGNSAAGAAPDDRFVVLVSTDNGATWSQSNVLREWNNTGSQYVYDNISRYGEHVIIPLTTYQGQSVKIAFYGESQTSNGDNYFYIDNVTIQQIVSCYPVTNVAVNNVTAASVDLSWNDNNGTPDSWTIIYGAPGFNPATEGTNVTANTNPFTLSGLTPQTSYDVYVRANCVTGSDVSALSSVYTFATTCTNPCYDSIFMTDDYGDGWEGHTIDLYVNGNLSAQYTLASGSEGSAIVQMCPGDQVQFRWSQNGGTMYGENNFEIYNHDNELIYSCTAEAGLSTGIVLWTGRACFTPNCHVPNALTASVTYTTATLDWNETTTPAPTQWVLAYQSENDVNPTYVAINTKPYTLTGLTANTNYAFAVRAVCEPGVDSSDWSSTAYFYTGYCVPAPSSVDNSGMTNIVFGDNLVVNTDTTTGLTYGDFSNLVGDAGQGTSAEVVITYATGYTYGTHVWVDWNNDLDFDDEGELVFYDLSSNVNPTTLTANFTVPATATLGDYRMRIGGSDNDNGPDPCYTGTYACLFDFTLRVTPAPTCYKPTALAATNVYGKQVNLSWNENTPTAATQWQLCYTANGETTYKYVNTNNNYLLTGLTPETEYTGVMVRAICGAGDTSNWSSPISFTTSAACFVPTGLTGSALINSVTLSWTENTMPTAATRWEVAYGTVGFDPDDETQATYVETTNNTDFEITGLRHSRSYQFYVRALCGDEEYSNWSNALTLETQCGAWSYADMPLTENFDGVTGTTTSTVSVLPNSCWSKINTGTTAYGRPQVYSNSTYAASGTNSMYFYVGTTTSYANNYAILPEMGFDLDTIAIELSARFGSSTSEITIGVMSDPDDEETFVPVTTIHAPSSGYSTHATYTADLQEYTGNARYIVIAALKGSSTNYFYIDDLQVKLREKVNTLPNNGATLAICNEVVIPDTANATYSNNVNATYIITPAETGKVLRLRGDYNLELGYDFLDVYEGIGTDATLVATLTGKGSYEYKTDSYNWVAKGGIKMVFRTDGDNSLPNLDGFHFLATCECPEMVPETEILTDQGYGTYTWTAPNGNGETYTHNVVLTGLTYGDPEETVADIVETYNYTQVNVAGCDSINKEMTLTLHPTYSKTYDAEICERETFSFYGQQFTTTGTYTVPLTSVFGADSIGILNLQVHAAPTVAITYNGRVVTTVENFCDNADMNLLARSNTTGATFVWDDNSTGANRVVNPHENNTYTVVATEPTYGCTSVPATLTVTTTPVPELSITATEDVICRGQSTTLSLTDANNTEATYTWKANGATVGNEATLTVSPTTTTTYTATATTTTGACVATAEYTITVNQLPVVTAEASVSAICSDSIITLTATPVEGYSYLWNTGATTATATVVAAATADYTVTVTDANGCVNEFTTATVTVRPSYERNVTMDVCYTQNPYTWGAQQLTADGNYDQMFTAQNGCDSLIHLTFTFQQMSVFNTPREVCEGTVLTWGPETVTATENTVVSYILNAGDMDPDNNVLECPAQYNLNLTVNHPAASSFERTVCDTYTWPLNNETYTESGAYPVTLATTKGCDSVVTMNLTVNYHVYTQYTVEHACDSYTWNNETYTEAGDYVQEFTGYQCDSTRTLHLLVVDNTTYGTDNILFCGDAASWVNGNTGYTWIDGVTYTMSETDGNITYNLQGANQYGCDSIATLNLTLNPVAEVMNWTNVTACDEFSIDTISCDGVRGTKYINQSGDYQLRTPTATAGRDVLTQIHLTINHSGYHTNVVTACVPYDWRVVVGQDTVTGEDIEYLVGTYTEDSYVSYQMPDQYSANGCSRIEILRLTALYPTEDVTEATICQDGSWTAPDQSITYYGADLEIGVNAPKLWNRSTNAAGCNYDQKVVLTVNPVYPNATAQLTFCESEFVNNQLTVANALNATDEPIVLTIAGALNETPYTNTINANWHTQNGCDSTVAITYTVNPTTFETVPVTTCYRYSWDANGETYTESGEYTYNDQGANIYHCDNIITLQLTLNDSVIDRETEYHCSDYEYEGVVYRETQTFREVLEPTAEGCEHIRYITHAVIPTQMTDLYVVTNVPYTWQNGVTYTESVDPVYYETTTLEYAATNDPTNVTMCDSILVLHLTMLSDTVEFCENELPYTASNGVVYTGNENTNWAHFFDSENINPDATSYTFVGSDVNEEMTWKTIFYPGEHNGVFTVYGTEFGNYESDYFTVRLDVNGETRATKTITGIEHFWYQDVFFDDPVSVNDEDLIEFVYTATSPYSIYCAALYDNNGNSIGHPDNYKYYYGGSWYDMPAPFNFEAYYAFGYKNLYTNFTEDHHDTILYYVVNRNANVTLNETACDSYTWDANGQTYTESGVYTYQTTTAAGCDSIVVLNLTINQNSTATLAAVEACDQYEWIFGGVTVGTYTESGNHTYSYNDANNCPSVATLPLTINNSQNITLDAVNACDTYTWEYNNETVGTYTEGGDKTYNYNDATTGCAVNVTLPLTINASTERDETIVVNAASTYYPDANGNYYVASDTPYTFDEISTNAAGCPETIHVTLIVHQGATVDVEVNGCGEYTWETANNGNGHTYKWISTTERQQNSALYLDITDPANPVYVHIGDNPTFATFNGDGTVNTTYVLWLNLSEAGYMDIDLGNVLLSQQTELTVNGDGSLDDQTIDLSDFIAAQQNATLNVTLRHNDPTGYYCGNIVNYTANLVWNYDTVEATVCDATTYTWTEANETFAVSTANDFANGGNMMTHIFNAGTATEQVTTMKVNVTARTNSDPQVVDSCFTYTWTTGDGQTYTTSGTYTWNDDVNCTLETLNLTIYENSSYTATPVVVCDSYTWAATADHGDGQTYTATGDITNNYTDANGCPATVTLPLTINVNHGHSTTATACDSYTWSANDGNDYTLTSTQNKYVTYSDVNNCQGVDTLILTINNSTNGTDVQTACNSFEWIVNNTTVGTYTESNNTDSYTVTNGNAAGCDSTVTLNLTVYHPRVFSREQYAYGNGITINGHFYEAPTTGVAQYDVVLDTVDPEANNCATIVNVTLYVSQYEYYYTNYVACGNYTWSVNNHAYRSLTDDEELANPTALYFDETDNAVVTSNPMVYTGSRIDVLNLTINKPSVTNITRTVLMSQLEAGNTLTLEGNVEDFSNEYAAHQNATVTRSYSLGAHATCDSIVNYTINLVWNYDTVTANLCDVTSYTWTEANETFTVTTGDNYKTHVFNAGTETEQVTTMKVTVQARTEDPQTPVTVCDSYTWHGTEYTASANLEFNNDENCTHETLALTINTNAGSSETVEQCFTYTWNVPTYELDATNNTYVAADDITNTYTESGVKTVTFIDANGCQGTATLNLTINADQSETLTAVTACDSYEWTYNSVVVGTYTESGDKTYDWTDVHGCAATATLPLTINYSESQDVEFWEGDGSYRYEGFFAPATAQMLSASPTPYTFTEIVAGATTEGCDSIYNITLHVGNSYYLTETYRSCNSFTWNRNNHTYVRLTDAQANENPTVLYFDETANEMVYYNPTVNIPNEGTYDSVFMLQLTLDAVWDSTAVINFPVSMGTLTFKGRTYDFSMTNDEGRLFDVLTRIDTIHFAAQTFCDSIYYVTINVYNNYREVETADICATTESYTWRGQTISTVTTDYDNEHTYYIYDAINANDSVEYLTITQHPVTYATERREACDSYTWPLNGQTYTASTSNETYIDVDEYGCDRIVTLTLRINHSSSNFIETAACETYTWYANNAAQTEIGTYTATPNDTLFYNYVSDEGCPSTDTLLLTVNHNTNTNYTVDACDSYTWTAEEGGDGRVLTASGVETYDYNTVEGCPSTNTLTLTIRTNSNQTFDKVICDSYTWAAADGGNNEEYTVSGTYTYDYTADNGCPSTNTLNLTINTNAGSEEDATVCDSYTWNAPDGETYVLTSTQVKTINFTDLNGCVGEATLNLTINVNEGTVEDVAECQNYTWPVNGVTYTTSGTYTEPFYDVNNCEGTATLNLTIGQQRVFVTQNITNCGTYTWIVNDSTLAVFDQSTEASASLPNSLTGCDSVIILNLTVLNAPVVDEGETVICESALPFTWEGTEYTEGGELTKSWPLENNCDSVRTMTLTVTPTIHTNLTDAICLGLDYTANGFNIAAADLTAGEHTFTRTETNATTNCDEEITLTLTVGDVLSNDVDAVTACDSYSWTAGDGQTYELTATGTYQSQPYANAMGCTTIDVLPLTILTNGGSEETKFACDSYTWSVNGETYTTSGDYTATITDATTGCNGTATLHLTIGTSEVVTTNATACDSYTWTDGTGETYTQSGVYTHNYTTTDNCSGTLHLVLTINNNSSTAYTQTACDSYTWNNEVYTATGDYTFAYNDANECPSVDTLHLTVNINSNTGYTETACDSYTWNNSSYTESGDYMYDYINAKGCPSTDTLHLTVNHNTSSGETLTVCYGYEWHGTSYIQSGTYYYHYNTNEGCASIDTLNLTVNMLSTSSVNETVCESYTWDLTGETYTESDMYIASLVSAVGCDSIITLYLTVNHGTNNSEDVTACDSYTWHDATYTASGVQTFAYTNNAGCPSVDTLHLTLNNSVTGSETAEACNYFVWNGTAYTQSGVYTQTLDAANGCDSVVTLNLTINTQVTENISATACNSYTWNGAVYTATGVYTQNFTSAAGCDSVVTLALTINLPRTTTLNVTACDSYTWMGTTYNATGNYDYTTVAANGCDSIVTLALTVNSSTTSSQNVTACDSYTWNGQNYTASGTYSFNTFAANGCDSVVTLHLTLNNSTTGTVSVTTCGSYTWMDGQTYTASTNAPTVTLVNASGCDSVVTLHLTINQPITGNDYATACGSYTWEGTTYTVSGNYTHTYNASNGCDSIVTMHLTINQPTSSSILATACESYTWEGATYTTSGNYTHTYTAANNCDSVVTLQLTINNSTSSSFNQTACSGYTWEGTTYTTSGAYTHTYTAANNCDSVVTMNLTINQPVTSNVYITACDSYTWEGTTYSYTGAYTHTYTAANDCDSVVVLVLTINHSVSTVEEVTECDGFIWIDNINYTESTNTPTVTLRTINGCDSVVTLHLTINHSVEIYDSIEIFENQLPYNYYGNSIDAEGDYMISGTTVNGCDSTVYLHVSVRPVIGIEVTSALENITVYPNPTRGHSTVTADDVMTIEVFDIVGHMVAKFENTNQIDISNLVEGSYTLRITTPNGTAVRRLIKK